MSVESCRRQIESDNRELGQLHQRLADERRREAHMVARIGQVERSTSTHISVSSFQSKARAIELLNRNVAHSKRKQAEFSRQIAAKEVKKHGHERDLVKEQEFEERTARQDQESRLARFEADLRRTLDAASSPRLPADLNPPAKVHDVFISHASEDKESLVRQLADGLRAHGVNVWYDEFELTVGDSLRRSIDRGLANSRFGIVVLSSAFFARNWPQYELDGLVTKETASGAKVILPIWHKVSKDEVAGYSPTLADRLALNTAVKSLDEIIEALVGVILPSVDGSAEAGRSPIEIIAQHARREQMS